MGSCILKKKNILIKPFVKVGKAFVWLGKEIGHYFRYRFSKQGLKNTVYTIIGMQALDKVIYYNGGRLHMIEKETRCGEKVPLDKLEEHLRTCPKCIAIEKENKQREELIAKLVSEYESKKQQEDSIEASIQESKIYNEAKMTVEEVLKLAMEDEKFAKKLTKLYEKFKPKLEEVKEQEIEESESKLKKVGSAIAKPIVAVKDGTVKAGKSIKTKIKNGINKIKDKFKKAAAWLKAHKKTLITLLTFAASYAIKYITGFSFLGELLQLALAAA